MNEGELVEFVYMAIGMGIVLQVYYPQLLAWCLPPVALVGAFYLVFGVLSKMSAGFFGHGQARRDDWWNGLAILSMIALWFGAPDLAVTAVQWIVSSVYLLFIGIFTIAL